MMLDLANLSLPSSLTLTLCSSLKPISAESADSSESPCPNSVKTLAADCNWDQRLRFPVVQRVKEACNGSGIKVFKRSHDTLDRAKKGPNGKGLEDHVRAWAEKKVGAGVPESRCFFRFLLAPRKWLNVLFAINESTQGRKCYAQCVIVKEFITLYVRKKILISLI